MTEYQITITIKGIETHSVKQLEKEAWRMRQIIVMMTETCEPTVIESCYSIASCLEAMKE